MTSPRSSRSSLPEIKRDEFRPDHPELPWKPPLAFLLAMAIGAVSHQFVPIRARPEGWAPLGVTLVAMSGALLAWAMVEFRAHHTPLEPWKSTRTIVDSGPFAFSRNPVYIAFALLQLGIGFWADRNAIVLLTVPAWLATARFIVPREEAYLERKFGETYLAYKRRVRRWL